MRSVVSPLLAVAFLLGSISPLWAGDRDDPARVQTRLKRVALFKNGLGFLVREGTLPGDSQLVLLGPFAAPSHGTFWVSCPQRAGLTRIVARAATVQDKLEARTIAELLRANVGAEVALGTATEPEIVKGTILSFAPDRPAIQSPHDRYAMGRERRESAVLPPGPGAFMLLETETGILAVDPARYSSVTFQAEAIGTTLVRETEKVELLAAFDGSPQPGDWLSASYLAKGITWAPSYLIDISDTDEARLTAKALIINEAEDLEETDVDLITGFPNLQFAEVLSPMGKKQDLAEFLRSLARGGEGRGAASVLTQNVMYRAEAEYAGAPMPDYGAPAAGQVAEDLFLYPVKDVALARGETGYYPLFTESVPYTAIHQWEIPDYINERDRYGDRRREERDRLEEVWHSVRLENTTPVPWTTAPAQLTKEGQIIGQDTLRYTPPKGEATVRITQAVSVRAEQFEQELKRQREALRMYGDYFDRVTIRGTLQVTNYKDEPISLEIEKTLSGEVREMSMVAEEVTLARGLRRMNPTHQLTWKFELGPGESEEITYIYDALIRR